MQHLLLAATLILTTTAVHAQEASGEQPTDTISLAEAPLRFDFDGGAWLVRAKGTGSNGGGELEIGDSGSTMGLGNLEALFRGELTISKDVWGVRVMGTHGSWSGNANVDPGTVITWGGNPVTTGMRSSLDMSWLAFEGHWDAITLQGDGKQHTNDPIDLVFGPHIGVAWLDLDHSLAGVDNSGNWWSVYGGGELSMVIDLKPFTNLLHSLTVDVGGSIGGTVADGGMFWKVGGGLGLNFTPNIGIDVGYRIMEYKNLTNNTWDLSPSFPGLFIGLNVTF